MKSVYLMLVICYVQYKNFMFTALFLPFSAWSKLPISDQVNFDRLVETPVFMHPMFSLHTPPHPMCIISNSPPPPYNINNTP